jgi:ABC-type Fe3+-hydroxamate transport system substrate-binding protein
VNRRRAATRAAGRLALAVLLGGAGATAAHAQAPGVAAADGLGRVVRLPAPARRVVSTVPSATDLLVALGVADRVVGRTTYDTAAAVRGAAEVGGGTDPSLERVLAARPDLLLAWPEPSAARVRNAAAAAGVPVFAVGLRDTAALYGTIAALGRLTARDAAAGALAGTLRARLDAVRARSRGPARTAVFVASERPVYVAGARSFVMEVAGAAGLRPAFPEVPGDWPALALEAIVRRDPEVLLVPRRRGDAPGAALARLRAAPGWRDLRAVRLGRVISLDGDAISRPGPRLADAAEAIAAALGAPPPRPAAPAR